MKVIYCGESNQVPFGTIGETHEGTSMFTYRDFNGDIQYFDYSKFDKNEILFIEYQNMIMGFNQWLRNKTILLIAERNKLKFNKYCTMMCHDISFNNEYVIRANNGSKWYMPDWDLSSLWVIDSNTQDEFHAVKIKAYILAKLNELKKTKAVIDTNDFNTKAIFGTD